MRLSLSGLLLWVFHSYEGPLDSLLLELVLSLLLCSLVCFEGVAVLPVGVVLFLVVIELSVV